MFTLTRHRTKLSRQEEKLVSAMQALGDKTRFKMVKLMLADKQLCVSEIAEVLRISTPAVSQHFRILELTGLVDKERDGRRICYTLRQDNPLINELIKQA